MRIPNLSLSRSKLIKNSILYMAVLLMAVGLKYHYSHARSDDLGWILGPTAGVVEYFSGIAFEKEHGIDPLDIDPKDREKVKLYNDWRRLSVSRLVEAVTRRAHEAKPGIRVSAAVLERYHLARASHCYQDWIEWMQSGKIDTCCIMAYNTDNPLVAKRIRMAVENQGESTVWAGLSGNWGGRRSNGTFESVLERVDMVRREKPEGIMFFAYKHFDDTEIKALKDGPFSTPSAVPETQK